MSHFILKARKPNGEVYTQEKDAEDRYELYKTVREAGEEVLSVEEKQKKKIGINISIPILSGIKTIEKINFARNLGSMLQAGLALSRALSVLERQSRNKKFKKVLSDILSSINKGMTFSDSLSHYPKIFSPLFISMVHSGEQSGTLADSLKVVATQMESIHSLEKKVKGALMYPAVIILVIILIAVLMFIFVIPTLIKTFTDLNVELPFATRVVIEISDLIQNHGIIIFGLTIVFIGSIYWWTRGKTGKSIWHKTLLKIPVIGSLIQEVNTARTARTMSSLLASGVDVVESVSITATVVQNVHFKAVLVNAGEAIKKGELMSKIFNQATNLYPIFFAEMMDVGEETGKTGEMLMGVAKYYEEDVEQRTKDMSTVIEPFLMLFIGAAVGFFAIAMLSPMYSLVNVM